VVEFFVGTAGFPPSSRSKVIETAPVMLWHSQHFPARAPIAASTPSLAAPWLCSDSADCYIGEEADTPFGVQGQGWRGSLCDACCLKRCDPARQGDGLSATVSARSRLLIAAVFCFERAHIWRFFGVEF